MSARDRRLTTPFVFFFLVLPTGISTGFVSFAFPFILTEAGIPLATAAAVVATAGASNFFRFLWGPVADFTLTPRIWYLIGLFTTAGTLLLVGFFPLHPDHNSFLFPVVFIAGVAATLVMLPLGGLMAHTVLDDKKGRAAGWYQAGNLAGNGVGGGVGVFLAAHYSRQIAASTIAVAMLTCAIALLFVPNIRSLPSGTFRHRMGVLKADVLGVFRHRTTIFVILLVCSPIGAGALSHLWGGIRREWHMNPDTVALVSGAFCGVTSAVGCVVGGMIADRFGRWWAYFGSGIGISLVAIAMVLTSHVPAFLAAGMVAYSFMQGLGYAAFSALVLFAIGRGAASTKYALLSSLGNLPVAYMITSVGWVHDRFGMSSMLVFDGVSGLVCVVPALFVLQRIKAARSQALRSV